MTALTRQDGLLHGLPTHLILSRYSAAPGNEVASGRFMNLQSSGALAANAFGLFLDRPELLPPLPIPGELGWPAVSVDLEIENRFPWAGGRHPWLDVLIETASAVVGIESKRYEPFRSKSSAAFSDAYWRPVWGGEMARFCNLRDDLHSGALSFRRLDAVQLVKHAFGLRTSVHRADRSILKRPVLLYLFAEPEVWPDGRRVDPEHQEMHRREIRTFAERVAAGDEVAFLPLSYRDLLATWRNSVDIEVRAHAAAVEQVFAP